MMDLNSLDRRGRYGVWLATAAAVCGVAALWLSTSQPDFEATATVLLGGAGDESDGARKDASELALLQSGEVVASAVRAAMVSGETGRGSGPVAVVEDGRHTALSKLSRVLQRRAEPDGRLFVSADGAIPPMVLEFPSPDTVRVTRPGGIGRRLQTHEVPFESGQLIELEDLSFRLTAEGDVTGRRFDVESVAYKDAVMRVRRGTQWRRSEGRVGVAEVSLTDSDPDRAVDLVNAMAREYVTRSRAEADRAVAEEIAWLEAQLETATQGHDALAADFPDTVDPVSTEHSRRRLAELERIERDLARSDEALRDALDLVMSGDTAAVTRLDGRLLDSVSERLVGHLVDLSMQRLSAPTTADPAVDVVARRRDALAADVEELLLTRARLAQILQRYRSGDVEVLSQLDGHAVVEGGATAVVLLGELSRLRAERERNLGAFTAEHPVVKENDHAIASLEARVMEQLQSRITGIDRSVGLYRTLIDEKEERIASLSAVADPGVDRSIEQVRAWLASHLDARLGALQNERDAIAREIESLEPVAARPVAVIGADRDARAGARQAEIEHLQRSLQQARMRQRDSEGATVLAFADDQSVRARPQVALRAALGGFLLLGFLALLVSMAGGLPRGPVGRVDPYRHLEEYSASIGERELVTR